VKTTSRLIQGALWVSLGLAIAGCVTVRTTGAASAEDLQAEDRYKADYASQMAKLETDLKLFAPTASAAGVCNVGGLKQGCFDVDSIVIADYRAMLTALAANPVPPRFADADALLRQAIADSIRGLELRNRAIAQNDQAAWTEQKSVLSAAVASFTLAWQTFPADNRPQPTP
jgi:hypothetical protein